MGRRTSYAYVVFADGTIHKSEIQDKADWAKARQEALEFNLLTGKT